MTIYNICFVKLKILDWLTTAIKLYVFHIFDWSDKHS